MANTSDYWVTLVHVPRAGAERLVAHGFVVADPVNVAEGAEQVTLGAVPVGVAEAVA